MCICFHLFPTLHSVTICWDLGVGWLWAEEGMGSPSPALGLRGSWDVPLSKPEGPLRGRASETMTVTTQTHHADEDTPEELAPRPPHQGAIGIRCRSAMA